MMLLRGRHEELDPFRSTDHRFNVAWLMFFGTQPPGTHSFAVKYEAADFSGFNITAEVSGATGKSGQVNVEPYDGAIHNHPGMDQVHGGE